MAVKTNERTKGNMTTNKKAAGSGGGPKSPMKPSGASKPRGGGGCRGK